MTTTKQNLPCDCGHAKGDHEMEPSLYCKMAGCGCMKYWQIDPDTQLRAEADDLAHDKIAPEQVFVGLDAVDLYVEAFMAGAKYQETRAKDASR